MKKMILLLLGLTTGLVVIAQKSSLVFYTEQGEGFYLFLNGNQQNFEPLNNLMIADLNETTYKVRVQFEDHKYGEISKNLTFGTGTETTYVIRQGADDAWVIRYTREVPLESAPLPPADRSVISYRAASAKPVKNPGNGSTQVSDEEEVSAGVSVSDPASGVVINLNIGTVSSSSTTTSSISTTTATTTTSVTPVDEPSGYIQEPAPVFLPGYTGPVGCNWPMSQQDFSGVKNSISSKSFEDSKLTIAKQVLNSNCLLCSQVKEIMLLFSFEDTRLEFAKYAYGYTYDIGNYYQLNDAFTFESSIDELNEYIGSFRK